MGIIANLGVMLSANGGGFIRELDRSKSAVTGLVSHVHSQFGSISSVGMSFTGPSAGIALAAVGIKDLGMAAISTAADYETLEIAFTSLAGGAEEAKKLLSDLSTLGAKTPFQFEDLAKGAQTLLSYGFSAKEAYGTIASLGDVAAASTVGMGEGLQRISLAIGQIKAKGKTQTQELKQLAEVGISAFDALAVRLGVDTSKAMKMVEAGQVSAEDGINAILDLAASPKFAGLMQRQSESLNGLWSTLKDNASIALREVGMLFIEAFDLKGLTSETSSFIEELSAHIEQLRGPIMNAGALFRAFFDVALAAGQELVDVIGQWSEGVDASDDRLDSIRNTALDFIEGVVQGFNVMINTIIQIGSDINEHIIQPLKDSLDMITLVPRKIGGGVASLFAKPETAKLTDYAQEILDAAGVADEAIASSNPFTKDQDKITDFFDRIRNGTKDMKDGMEEAAESTGKFQIKIGGISQVLQEARDKYATPLENFEKKMEDLQQFAPGGKNEDATVFVRASAAAFQELEKSVGDKSRLASAPEMNTKEAVSAINQAYLQRQNASLDDPQERVRRVLEESKRIQERQAKAMEALAEELGDWDVETADEG